MLAFKRINIVHVMVRVLKVLFVHVKEKTSGSLHAVYFKCEDHVCVRGLLSNKCSIQVQNYKEATILLHLKLKLQDVFNIV